MDDLKQRLAPMDDVQMPDLWRDIEHRTPDPAHRGVHHGAGRDGWRRAATIAAAFAIFAAAGVFAWRAFESPNQPTPGAYVSPPGWLIDVARQMARSNGDPDPISARWVLTDAKTLAPAVGLTPGQATSDPRYLVVLEGHFVGTMVLGQPAPSGTTIVFAADPDTHQVTGWGLSNRVIDVTGLRAFDLSADSISPSPDTALGPQGSPVPPSWSHYDDPDNGLSVSLPPDWQVSEKPLTQLIDPTEILSVGTFAMTPGGRCPQFPTNAISDMGPRDAFITIMDRKRLDPSLAPGPPRPASFGPTAGTSNSEVDQCLGTPKAFFDRWIPLSDQGREFYVFVAMGSDVSDQRRDDTWSVLDSLVFDSAAWTTSMVSVGEPAIVRDGESRTWILVELDDSPSGSFEALGPVPACEDGSAGQVEIVGDHRGIQLTCKEGVDPGWFGDGRALDSNPPEYGGSLGVMPLIARTDGTLTRVES